MSFFNQRISRGLANVEARFPIYQQNDCDLGSIGFGSAGAMQALGHNGVIGLHPSAPLTASAIPTFGAGMEGQVIHVFNLSNSNSYTLQDKNFLTGSGVILPPGMNTFTLGPGQGLSLVYMDEANPFWRVISSPLEVPYNYAPAQSSVTTGVSITAANITSHWWYRSGLTGDASDTTVSAAAIIAAAPIQSTQFFGIEWTVVNDTVFALTIAPGNGVTIPNGMVHPLSKVTFFVRIEDATVGAEAVTFYRKDARFVDGGPQYVQSGASADSGTTMTAAQIFTPDFFRTGWGSPHTDTTDTAANIVAASPIKLVNYAKVFSYVNLQAQTSTFAAGSGVSLSGSGAVAANTQVDWRVRLTNVGSGTEAVEFLRQRSFAVAA